MSRGKKRCGPLTKIKIGLFLRRSRLPNENKKSLFSSSSSKNRQLPKGRKISLSTTKRSKEMGVQITERWVGTDKKWRWILAVAVVGSYCCWCWEMDPSCVWFLGGKICHVKSRVLFQLRSLGGRFLHMVLVEEPKINFLLNVTAELFSYFPSFREREQEITHNTWRDSHKTVSLFELWKFRCDDRWGGGGGNISSSCNTCGKTLLSKKERCDVADNLTYGPSRAAEVPSFLTKWSRFPNGDKHVTDCCFEDKLK